MKVVVYGPERRVGALVDERVIDLNRAYARYLRERHNAANPDAAASERVPADLEAFISSGAAGLEAAQAALAHATSTGADDVAQPLAAVKLHAPSVYRPRVACAGANYVLHLVGTRAMLQGEKVSPEEAYRESRAGGAWGFWKVTNVDLRGDGDDVVYPARAGLFDYEGEVAVVFGQRAADVPAERASDVIWGVTLLNDWSIRDGMGPPRPLSFNLAKNFDGSVSLGPCIVVGELDPQDIVVETRVNGDVRQHYSSTEMTFSFAELIAYLSRDFTFVPGDILAGGTGAGTAMDTTPVGPDGKRSPARFLKPGDQVEVSSPGIGALRNRIVAKPTGAESGALAAGASRTA
jgi:2-keto-4-pentenoate hydratase/2-oxohepta-3-ene-1,7-dioic acid hydratase in catechol pathway